MKTGLRFIQVHWKWHHLIDRIRVPIIGLPDRLREKPDIPSLSSIPFTFPSSSPLFPFLPLEVGPLNPVRGSGGAL